MMGFLDYGHAYIETATPVGLQMNSRMIWVVEDN
jgi:hypothetical protein